MALIRFDEAMMKVASLASPPLPSETVPLEDALNRILREEIASDDDYPRFDNSAVDGFALFSPANSGEVLKLTGTVPAGSASSPILSAGLAARIFTGAKLPAGTCAVVMQEDVAVLESGHISLREPVEAGQNIRRQGSELRHGEVLLYPGSRLNPGAISLLALSGKTEVLVSANPRIAILTTGDELVDSRDAPTGSQIRDTSGPMLSALMRDWGLEVTARARVRDEPDAIREALRSLAAQADILVVTGGVSVGGRDYLPEIQRELGEVFFHGVMMRPGKPVLFGSIGQCLVFGLAGNPGGSFVACHTFVRRAIEVLRGERGRVSWIAARYAEEHRAYPREDFVRVILEWRDDKLWAVPKFEQASFGLRSLAACQGVARLPGGIDVHRGDPCRVLLV